MESVAMCVYRRDTRCLRAGLLMYVSQWLIYYNYITGINYRMPVHCLMSLMCWTLVKLRYIFKRRHVAAAVILLYLS